MSNNSPFQDNQDPINLGDLIMYLEGIQESFGPKMPVGTHDDDGNFYPLRKLSIDKIDEVSTLRIGPKYLVDL